MRLFTGLAFASMLLAAACSSSSDDTSDALSAVCDSQEEVAGELEALAALDPAVNTSGEYTEAIENLQDAVDDLRDARSDLNEQDVENLENAYDDLRSDLEGLDDVPLAEADAAVGEASDAQIEELARFYDAAFASSTCAE